MKVKYTSQRWMQMSLDIVAHETISSAIKDRLWHLPPQEIRARLMWTPAPAFNFLALLVKFETAAAAAGTEWLTHIDRPLGAITDPTADSLGFGIEFSPTGSVWTIDQQEMWFVSRSLYESLTRSDQTITYMLGASHEFVKGLADDLLAEEKLALSEFELRGTK